MTFEIINFTLLTMRNIFACYFVIILGLTVNTVYAQNELDAKGVVLGASVARSEKEQISKLPVETYFGNPNAMDLQSQINNLNLTIHQEDIVTSFPDPQMKLGSIIRVTRATPVKVRDGNKEIEYRTWLNTVNDLLDEQKIELGQDDKIDPTLTASLQPNQIITITRVEITKVTTKEPIDFKKVAKDDPTLDKGLTKVQQTGKKGERTKVFEVRRENGEEVSRKLQENKVTKDSINELTFRGTKEVVYGTGKATWFSAPAMTAAHNTLPRGTMVEVKNLANSKTVVVKIIGGGIMGGAIIDLSPDAFKQLAPLGTGVIQVRLTKP